MALSPWTDFEKIQTATCDDAGTTTVIDKMCSCSDCGSSWPIDATAPVSSVMRQVPL